MKRFILSMLVIFVGFNLALSQEINITFTPEGIQSANEDTDLLLSDPLINQVTFYVPPSFKKKKEALAGQEETAAAMGLTVGMETEVSGPNKSFTIPVNYAWRDFNFGLSLPYIFQRKMNYIADSKSASGLGDIAVSAAYHRQFMDIFWDGSIFLKLPTGDSEKTVDGYLVPLGTGSTDMVFNLAAMKPFNRYTVSASAMIKINGGSSKISEIAHSGMGIETLEYDIHNGNMFSLTGRFDYFYDKLWTFGGIAVFTIVGEGYSDISHDFDWDEPDYTEYDISNKQDMTLIDLIPNASYKVMNMDVTFFLKIPLVTVRNEDNNEGSRGVTALFKLSREL